MMRAAIFLSLVAITVWMTLASNPRPVLFVNGHILTLDAESLVADSILISDGKVEAIGPEALISKDLPIFTRTIDLDGRTVLPGFVDAHSHFPSSGLTQAGLDLTPPPVGNVSTLQLLLDKVSKEANSLSKGDWIIGFNYDDASLDIARHPTREELDAVSPGNPVYLWHRSGHMGVANTLALEALGHHSVVFSQIVEADQPDRDERGQLTGLLQEGAAPRLSYLLKKMQVTRLLKAMLYAKDEYLSAGVTTVQNGFADIPSMRMLRWAQRLGVLPQRVVVWPAHDKLASEISLPAVSALAETENTLAGALGWPDSNNKFSIAALKLIVDGSPQGRTAWLTQPYLKLPGNATLQTDEHYHGHPAMPVAEFKHWVNRYHRAGFQLAIHGNGDAAIDLIIATLREAQSAYYREDARHMLVHGQVIRQDQLSALAELGVSVTFFPSHTFYWGDWYRSSVLGDGRARQITPLAAADAFGLQYSLHSDAPVTPISPLDILWSATNRETLSGFKLGPEYNISRERALRALTIDAAWQNHLEHDRGSLEPGKLADLIVLSGDPLTHPDVRQLQVEQVWIGGKRHYSK